MNTPITRDWDTRNCLFRIVKNIKLLTLLAALGTFLLVYFFSIAGREQLYYPTEADFKKITFEMSEEEVNAIMGPPHKVLIRREYPNMKVFLYYGRRDKGSEPDDTFNVKIDAVSGRVCGYGNSAPRNPSMIEWVKEMVGL